MNAAKMTARSKIARVVNTNASLAGASEVGHSDV